MANDEGNRSGSATNNQSSNGIAVEERRPSSQVHFTESTRGVDGPRPIAPGQDEVAMSGITVPNESSRTMLSNLTHDTDRINGVGNISGGENTTRSKDSSNSREEIIKPDGPLAEFRYQCGKFINYVYVEHFITFIIAFHLNQTSVPFLSLEENFFNIERVKWCVPLIYNWE